MITEVLRSTSPKKTLTKPHEEKPLGDRVEDLPLAKISSSTIEALADLLIQDLDLDVDIQRKIAIPKRAA